MKTIINEQRNVFIANYFSKEEETPEEMSKTLFVTKNIHSIKEKSVDYLMDEVIGNLLACDEGQFKIDAHKGEDNIWWIYLVTNEKGEEKARITITSHLL